MNKNESGTAGDGGGSKKRVFSFPSVGGHSRPTTYEWSPLPLSLPGSLGASVQQAYEQSATDLERQTVRRLASLLNAAWNGSIAASKRLEREVESLAATEGVSLQEVLHRVLEKHWRYLWEELLTSLVEPLYIATRSGEIRKARRYRNTWGKVVQDAWEAVVYMAAAWCEPPTASDKEEDDILPSVVKLLRKALFYRSKDTQSEPHDLATVLVEIADLLPDGRARSACVEGVCWLMSAMRSVRTVWDEKSMGNLPETIAIRAYFFLFALQANDKRRYEASAAHRDHSSVLERAIDDALHRWVPLPREVACVPPHTPIPQAFAEEAVQQFTRQVLEQGEGSWAARFHEMKALREATMLLPEELW